MQICQGNEDYELLLQLLDAELPKDFAIAAGLGGLAVRTSPDARIDRIRQATRAIFPPPKPVPFAVGVSQRRVHFEHLTNDAVLQEIDALDRQCQTLQVSGGNDPNQALSHGNLTSLRFEFKALRALGPLSTFAHNPHRRR